MSKINRDFIEAIGSLGVNARVDKGVTYMDTTLASVLKLADPYQSLPFRDKSNSALYKEEIFHDRDVAWVGGTYDGLKADLQGKTKLTRFEAASKKLAESGLLAKLATVTRDITPKRKRRMSEHDGELDLARLYEIQPFYASHKILAPERTLDVVCNFAVSAAASSKSMDAYGAMVWGLVDVIERAGIRCRIVMTENGTRLSAGTREHACRINIELKKAHEYVSPSLLAAALQSNFKRRINFGLMVMAGECAGIEVGEHLGSPERLSTPIEFKNGVLTLAPNVVNGMDAEIEKQVLAAIAWKGEKI